MTNKTGRKLTEAETTAGAAVGAAVGAGAGDGICVDDAPAEYAGSVGLGVLVEAVVDRVEGLF